MERFLIWQEKFSSCGENLNDDGINLVEVPDGASEVHRPDFDQEDFERRGRKVCNDLPSLSNPSYFFEVEASDYIIVEFVSNPKFSTRVLEEERQFEVLPYGESIYWEGEKRYSSSKRERPPSLTNLYRSTELPGHFSNHACGSTASMYDCFRLRNKDDDNNDDCPIVAPAQSTAVRAGLEEFVSTGIFPSEGTPLGSLTNTMTSHRAMGTGEEVTTDYALWHWCNEDYAPYNKYDGKDWNKLPDIVRNAAVTLGYSKESWDSEEEEVEPPICSKSWKELSEDECKSVRTLGYTPSGWDDDDVEPWFDCVCRDPKCHSADGFRGVKHFSMEEQQRLYWICSLWIQQNIDWNVYQNEKK